MNYTSGHWVVNKYNQYDVCTTDGRMVSYQTSYESLPMEEAKANASLISASPDLYSSLKELLIIAEATPGAQCRVNRARAAIAKAEGR